jgi:hypothetical protein
MTGFAYLRIFLCSSRRSKTVDQQFTRSDGLVTVALSLNGC